MYVINLFQLYILSFEWESYIVQFFQKIHRSIDYSFFLRTHNILYNYLIIYTLQSIAMILGQSSVFQFHPYFNTYVYAATTDRLVQKCSSFPIGYLLEVFQIHRFSSVSVYLWLKTINKDYASKKYTCWWHGCIAWYQYLECFLFNLSKRWAKNGVIQNFAFFYYPIPPRRFFF